MSRVPADPRRRPTCRRRSVPIAILPEPTPVQEPLPEWVGKKAFVDAIHAPFELEPDEIPPIGVKPDYDQILSDRRIKKLKKAQSRRESERRKVEKLRA